MKKYYIAILLILCCVFSTNSVNAQGLTATSTIIDTEYLEDGSFFETIITYSNTSPLAKASSTASGSKTVNYKNSSGTILWYVKVNGTFTYKKGSSSTCTSASVTAASNNSLWKVGNKSSSKSGSTAKATATGTHYRGSTPINSVTKTVSLTCSKNGVLS